MKILYVADNRTKKNWGCRATGISLYQLLSGHFEVSATIFGDLVAKPIAMNTLLPARLDRLMSTHFSRIEPVYRVANRKLTRLVDFVTEDPAASVENFRRILYKSRQLNRLYQQLTACDAVVINGEGDMVFTTPPRRRLLFLFMVMELAHQCGKPYFYVNGMVSDCPINGRNERTAATAAHYLENAALVSVRDYTSLKNVQALAPKADAHYFPDALFSWFHYYDEVEKSIPHNGDYLISWPENNQHFGQMDFSEPYLCVGGSSSPHLNDEAKTIETFSALITDLKSLGYPLYVVRSSDEPFWEKVIQATQARFVPFNVPIVAGGGILANARVLISGRYHPSIFAGLGGTPSVFLASNSHKTRSLQDLLEYPAPSEFPALPENYDLIVNAAKQLLEEGPARRKAIRDAAQKRYDEVLQLPVVMSQRLQNL